MSLIGVTGPGVLDKSTTTGTGSYTLTGAVTGYQAVGAVLADGDTAYFAAYGVDANGNRNGDGWEEFYGTYTASGTALARTKIKKSSNSDAAVSWPAGTRRIALIDLPSKAKGINVPYLGAVLPNATFPRVQGINLATGNRDLYTVPTGRRAIVFQFIKIFNNSAGTIGWFPQIKSGGTYYQINGTLTPATGTENQSAGAAITLEAGEIFSVNVATTSGLNVTVQIVEFDDTAAIKSAKLLGTSTGDNTLYTCPAGKTAMLLTQAPVPFQAGGSALINIWNDAGGSHNFYFNLVPSGGTPGTTNKLNVSLSVGAGARSTLSGPMNLGAGDFISVNVSAGNAAQIVWASILEIG